MQELLAFMAGHQGAITALATVVIALMAVVTAVLTFRLARENRLLRRAGTEPEVVAYLTHDQRYKTMVNLALANVGQGPARNVRFRIDADEADFAAHEVRLGNRADRKPISLLPQGERIDAFFGAGHQLFKEPRLRPFDVSVEYQDLKGRKRTRSYTLDVSQFAGLVRLGRPAEDEIAEALKQIAKNFGHFATGFKRLKVETMTTADARKEQDEWLQELQEELARQKKKKDSDDVGAELQDGKSE